MSIKSLIVGLGNIGLNYDYSSKKIYQTHSSSIHKDKHFELIGAVETSIVQNKKFIKKYKKPTYNSFVKAVHLLKPELLVVCVPTIKSHKIYEQIINNQLIFKGVIFEKPINYSKKEVKKIFDYCKKKDIHIFVNYVRRFDISTQNIKKLILNRSIGSVVKIEVSYKKGFFNSCSHYINYLNFLFPENKKISKVQLLKKFNNDYLINFNLETGFSIIFKVINKDKDESIEIFGTKATIFYKTEKGIINIFSKNKTIKKIKNNYDVPLKSMYKNVYMSINKKQKPISSYFDGMETIDYLNRILSKI